MTIVRICANKRYAAVDKLVNEIQSQDTQASSTLSEESFPENLSVELFCKFWNILKANSQFDLEGAIQDRLKVCPLDDAVCSMAVCSCGKHTSSSYTQPLQHLPQACRDMMSVSGTHGQRIINMRCEISQSVKSSPGLSPETSESELCQQDVSQKPSAYSYGTCKLTENTSTSHQSCNQSLQCSKILDTNLCQQEAKKPRPHYCGIGIAPKISRQSSRVASEPSPALLKYTKTSGTNCCQRQQQSKKPTPHYCGIGIAPKKTSFHSCRDNCETINEEFESNKNSNIDPFLQEPKKPRSHDCGINKTPKISYHSCGEASDSLPEVQSVQCNKKFKNNLNQHNSSKEMSQHSFAEAEPLTVALQGINMAQIQDNNCAWRLYELVEAEERIREYMHRLEAKELLGIAQLQQADEIWAKMEEAYLEKLRESEEKQQRMLSQENEVRKNLAKWRKKEKDREKNKLQVGAEACKIEEQAQQKQKQLDKLTNECDCLRQRIETTKKELDQVHTNGNKKMNTFKKEQDKIEVEINALEKKIAVEKHKRQIYEQQGRGTVRGARDHFATACRVLLQTQLDRENLNAEEEALNLEMDVMNEAIMNCKEKCQLKMKSLRDEIIAVENNITKNNLKCVRCNACVSTSDIKKRCIDCPRCLKGTCQYKDKACNSDDCGCVCPDVKERFVENILDNMHKILESDMKRSKSSLALEVLKCLKQSKNGKLDAATRQKIHIYVMKTVGKNLDAAGAAVKTKSEIEPKELAQLQLCLKEVIVGPLQEKGGRRKESKTPPTTILNMAQMSSCKKWDSSGGGGAPCDCPGSPDTCVCWDRAPAPGSSNPVGAARSGVLKKTSLSTPKAHSCATGKGKVTTEASKASRVSIVSPPKVRSSTVHSKSSVTIPSAHSVSISSVRSNNATKVPEVRSETRSACACTTSEKGPCRCIRSTKSRSSMRSKGSCSNAEYTGKIRDKLIKDVTNAAQPRSSTQMALCSSHYSGSCTCIEEKELKLHRPSSHGSQSSGPPGLKRKFSQQSQKKSSTTVCNPPSDPTGTGFMKRFSAASSRHESEKQLRKQVAENSEKLLKSEGTGGGGASSCLNWICCKKKGKLSNSVNEVGSGSGKGGSGIGGTVTLEGTSAAGVTGKARDLAGGVAEANAGVGGGPGPSGELGRGGAAGARGEDTGASAGGEAGTGADGAGTGADGAGTGANAGARAGVGADASEGGRAGTDGRAVPDTDASGRGGAGTDGRAGPGTNVNRNAGAKGPADVAAGTQGSTAVGAANAGTDVSGAAAASGGKGAVKTGGSGSGAGGGGRGLFEDSGRTGAEGLGSLSNKLEQSWDSKQPAAKGKVNLLSRSASPNVQSNVGRAGQAGANDVRKDKEMLNISNSGVSSTDANSPIRKRTSEMVKPSLEFSEPENSSEPYGQSLRESLLPSFQMKMPQTKIKTSSLKESSANTDNKDNLADDPCLRSYRRRFRKTQGGRRCKQKRRICVCDQNNPITEVSADGIRRHRYMNALIEPQLPEFLRCYQLPRSSFN